MGRPCFYSGWTKNDLSLYKSFAEDEMKDMSWELSMEKDCHATSITVRL